MTDAWKTQLDAAAKRIASSGTLALVLPDAPGMDIIGSSAALASGLRSLGKTVSIFAPPALPGTAIPQWGEYHAEDEPLREFIISFDLARSPIKELKYERGENRLDIILSPTGSKIRREDVVFRYGELRYDLVLALGVPAPEAASSSIRMAPDLLHEKPILNIDAGTANTGYGEVNVISPAASGIERPTLPELAYEMLVLLGAPPVEPPSVTALLAGLVAATRNFHPASTRPGAFRLAAELVARGGDLGAAAHALPFPRSFGEEQLAGRAIARSRLEAGESVLWAFLNPDDFTKTSSTSASVPAAADRIAQSISYADCIVLLWRETAEEPVRSYFVARDSGRIGRLTGCGDGETGEQTAAAGGTFTSFAEAEAHFARLLREGNAVE